MAITAAALSDPTRIRMVAALLSGPHEERCACELTALLGLAPSTISRHLAILRSAGIIQSRRDGRWVHFRPAEKPGIHAAGALAWIRRALASDPTLLADRRRLAGITQRMADACSLDGSCGEPPRQRVLFLCTGNTCRSQMAEGWARMLIGDRVAACSAGTNPQGLDPRAVRVMAENGVDISQHRSKHVGELLASGARFDCIVTVCDQAAACPVIPEPGRRIHAPFDDPPRLASDAGDEEAALDHYRRVRDEIRDFVAALPQRLRTNQPLTLETAR